MTLHPEKTQAGRNCKLLGLPGPPRNLHEEKQNLSRAEKRGKGKDNPEKITGSIGLRSTSLSSKSAKKVEILDATLRERTFGVSFSVGEKVSIASLLCALGVSFIESPAPDGNPNEIEYLKQAQAILRGRSDPVVFLPESHSFTSSSNSIVGFFPDWVKNVSLRVNCWQSHLTEGFSHRKIQPEENLRNLKIKLSTVKSTGESFFVYAQHFSNGFFEDTSYAISVLEMAADEGASRIVLCDSRGISFPEQVSKAVKLVNSHFSSRDNITLGIHCHNDLGLAVANTISAVQAGAKHVQGTVNGMGERSGNADLCQVLPILTLKLGYDALNSLVPKEQQLLSLKTLSEKVAEASGLDERRRPFVGITAFAHSDTAHIADVTKSPESYEVVNPAQVGNSRLLGVDDASLILNEMWELGLYTKEREDIAKKVLLRIRELEAFGCKFENAKASLHLLILDSLGFTISPFQVRKWETSTSRTMNDSSVNATIEVSIAEHEGRSEQIVTATAKGVGPIHAIDLALRKCLEQEFSELKHLRLISYSLNIVDSLSGTAATARARTEFSDEAVAFTGTSPSTTWATTSVSEDVLDASIKALIDGYRYKLIFRSQSEKYTLPDWRVALSWRYSERC